MNSSIYRSLRVFAFPCSLALMTIVVSTSAVAQNVTLREQIVGTWSLVAVVLDQAGVTRDMYGANPRGVATFGPNARYSLTLLRADLPKIISNNREAGTPEENKAIAGGVFTHFGRYSVNESDRTITFEIEACSFPNWNGAKQIRLITKLDTDNLTWTNPTTCWAPAAHT